MSLQVVRPGMKRQYICDVCGVISEWTSDWAWFGSMDDVEATLCSAACQSAYTPARVHNGRVYTSRHR